MSFIFTKTIGISPEIPYFQSLDCSYTLFDVFLDFRGLLKTKYDNIFWYRIISLPFTSKYLFSASVLALAISNTLFTLSELLYFFIFS